MLGYKISYNGVTLNDPSDFENREGISIERVSGMSSPEVKHREIDLIGQHGIVDFYSFVGKRIITLSGKAVGCDEDTCLDYLKTITDAFTLPSIPTTTNDGYKWLTFEKTGQTTLKIKAKINRLPRIEKDLKVSRMRNWYLEMRCENPRIISDITDSSDIYKSVLLGGLPTLLPTLLGVTGAGFSNEKTLTNDGNFGAMPIIRIYGACENPEITNVTHGFIHKFITTLLAGEYIDIDVLNGTATKSDGTNALLDETDDSTWIQILPGDNVIRYETFGNTPLSYCEIQWTDTWLSAPR